MAERWFRLPEMGTGTMDDPLRPKYLDGLDYSGRPEHPDGSPIWVVRVYGTTAELDDLASKQNAVELGGVPTDALNRMLGVNRTASDWERGFRVE